MWFIIRKNILLLVAAVIMIGSVATVGVFGLSLGIDFTGGALTEVSYETRPSMTDVDGALATLGLGGYSLRETTDERGRAGYILRSRDMTEDERVTVQTALVSVGAGGEITRFNSIGPVIGDELAAKSVWAIGGVSLIIVLYVAFAFSGVSHPVGSWVYGGITIFALIHDVLLPAAVMSLLGLFMGIEADILFVMALLAVLGYSVNDTIVVFDRVRENLKANRTEHKTIVKSVDGLEREEVSYTLTKPFATIVGEAVDQTLMRSLNTSFTTLLALIALYFVGGEVTKTFALILIAGVVAGAYSSICIASPLLVYIAERKAAKQVSA